MHHDTMGAAPMFRGLINDAKSTAGALVAKYLARASMAVPFVAALGFVTAAITLMLVERFGHIAAYWMVAGGFARHPGGEREGA
jgi:hypothetical protein